MTFNPAIPQPTDLISQSQAQIQTNFSQSDTAFAVDHTAFSVLANQGQHKKVTLIAPIANPNQAGNIASVYTKTSGTGVELFYQHGTLNAGVSQLTGGGITTAAYIQFIANPLSTVVAFNASVVRNSIGDYTVTFTRNFSSSNYLPSLTCDAGSQDGIVFKNYGIAAGSFQFNTRNLAGTLVDPQTIACLFFGTLA